MLLDDRRIDAFIAAQYQILRDTYTASWQRGKQNYVSEAKAKGKKVYEAERVEMASFPLLEDALVTSHPNLTRAGMAAALIAARKKLARARKAQAAIAAAVTAAEHSAQLAGVSAYTTPVTPPTPTTQPGRLSQMLTHPSGGLMMAAMGAALVSLASMRSQLQTISRADDTTGLSTFLGSAQSRLDGGSAIAWSGEQNGYAQAADASGDLLRWVTEGDDRVCEDCQAYGDMDPMPLGMWPTSPGSGQTECSLGCRCSFDTEEMPESGQDVGTFGDVLAQDTPAQPPSWQNPWSESDRQALAVRLRCLARPNDQTEL
jgi:hypothetical protein